MEDNEFNFNMPPDEMDANGELNSDVTLDLNRHKLIMAWPF